MSEIHAREPFRSKIQLKVGYSARADEERLPLLMGKSRVRIPPSRKVRSSVWIERRNVFLHNMTVPHGTAIRIERDEIGV